ncbi:hypothetical protein AAVH_00708 [Aphelenchoides avenae]|nr:hypothetical protein AAVH_00708 [Aphelenchus avenae]
MPNNRKEGKLTPQQAGHFGGLSRWHGRESIEKELRKVKKEAAKLGKELGKKGAEARSHKKPAANKTGSRGKSGPTARARGNKKTSGRRGGVGSKTIRKPAPRKTEQKAAGASAGRGKKASGGKGKAATGADLGNLSVKELGHLGGVARWHGRDAIEKELKTKRREAAKAHRRD